MGRRGKIIKFPGSAAPRERDQGEDRRLVEVHRCNQTEAAVVKSPFESEGIPTLLRSRLAHSVHPFSVGAQGEVTILVPELEVSRSRILLARFAAGPSS